MELRKYGDSKNSTKYKGTITNYQDFYVKLYYFSAEEKQRWLTFFPSKSTVAF